tara:strand:+ start:9443 stop:10201 length:759 start_codon:yes stop_codon:yes gene_type:complete
MIFKMELNEIKKGLIDLEVAGHKWWHIIELHEEIHTPGMRPSVKEKASYWKLNEINFKDKSVLDIGAWDGGFTFYAEKQGASELTSIDTWGASNGAMKEGEDLLLSSTAEAQWGSSKCFDFAAKALGSKAKRVVKNVYDVSPDLGQFDIVMFLGVFYHLRHPMLALEKIRTVIKDNGILLVETLVSPPPFMLGGEECFMQFFPGGLGGDPTTFCAPTKKCLTYFLNSANFAVNKIMTPEKEPNRAFCVCTAI